MLVKGAFGGILGLNRHSFKISAIIDHFTKILYIAQRYV